MIERDQMKLFMLLVATERLHAPLTLDAIALRRMLVETEWKGRYTLEKVGSCSSHSAKKSAGPPSL